MYSPVAILQLYFLRHIWQLRCSNRITIKQERNCDGVNSKGVSMKNPTNRMVYGRIKRIKNRLFCFHQRERPPNECFLPRVGLLVNVNESNHKTVITTYSRYLHIPPFTSYSHNKNRFTGPSGIHH